MTTPPDLLPVITNLSAQLEERVHDDVDDPIVLGDKKRFFWYDSNKDDDEDNEQHDIGEA